MDDIIENIYSLKEIERESNTKRGNSTFRDQQKGNS